MKKRNLKKRGAFTLMEMVTVIFIIGLLIIVFLPSLTKQQKNAEVKADQAFERTLQTQVDLYQEGQSSNVQITWDKMADDHYLTKAQVAKAQAKGYELVEGQVQKKGTAAVN